MSKLRGKIIIFAIALITLSTALLFILSKEKEHALSQLPPKSMRWIDAGEFIMGSGDARSPSSEKPAHRVRVDGFWIDENLVTNAQFRDFVTKTGYVTTAEQKPDWEALKGQVAPGTPKPDEALLVPGSLVFTPPPTAVSLDNVNAWWRWTPGASWQHPTGPDSNLAGLENHPVVHVSWDDVIAYATWVGKRLPTEAEWEYAARGGLVNKRFPWGDEFKPQGKFMANTFQGAFPHAGIAEDGYARTSPVTSFPANGYGLYDMAGNVWQWTSDWFDPRTYALRATQGVVVNPKGPSKSLATPSEPLASRRVIKGGSFLCNVSYCESYRPSARRGHSSDTGTSHIGFRLVLSKPK